MHPQIESMARYIYLSESIYEASGIELDRFGEYADIARAGMTDSDYRQAILSKQQRQSFSGTPDQLLQLLEVQTGTGSIILTKRESAAVNLHISDNANIDPTIAEFIDSMSIGGVRATISFGRGQKSFFFAGTKQTVLAIGVNGGKILSTQKGKGIGITTSRSFAFNNLAGMLVTPDLLATGKRVIGVNGRALALNKFSPKSAIANDGIRLAGTY